MLNLWTIFAVALASLITSQHASPLQKSDIQEILELVKGQNKYDDRRKKIESTSSDSSDTSSDEDSDKNHILRNMDVIDLIEKANQDKKSFGPQKRKERVSKKYNNQQVYKNYEINRHRNSQTQQLLEQLLQDKNTEIYENQKHQRLTPNNLLNPISLDDDDRQGQDGGNLNEYSQVYVILDPLALEKSKNEDAVNKLLSRILSQSSSANEKAYPERYKSSQYKGFKVKNNLLSRRYRRDSKETFGRDSLEDDYKPKRSRNDHGGGTGGRTAIPYIRQRGDIYERDH